jgi:hypothetical protein
MRPDAGGIVIETRMRGERAQARGARRSRGLRMHEPVRARDGALRFEPALAFVRRSHSLFMHSQIHARCNATMRFEPALAYEHRSCNQRPHDRIRSRGDAMLAFARHRLKHPRSPRRTPIYWNQKRTPQRRAGSLPRINSFRL